MSLQFIKDLIKNSFLYKIYYRRQLIKELGVWSVNDQKMLEFYSQFISTGQLCFDVGANIGNRVKIFLKLYFEVVAIEPQTECVKILKKVFGKDIHLKIIHAGLGSYEGKAELMISNANTISSMSLEWVRSVKQSGRFSEYQWNETRQVPITTLDKLISVYGIPDFVKIDVEGFEYQVIQGLSQPISTISLEFVPERIEPTLKCIDHLEKLGEIILNYSIGESMKLSLETWISPTEMKGILLGLSKDNQVFGDVYVKFI